MKRFIYYVLLLVAAVQMASAADEAEETRSTVQVLAAYETVRPGERLPIAVKIKVAEGWHTYAKEPGDSGMPPSIKLSGIDGLKVSEWRFPPHETFADSIGTSYGYEHEVVLLSDVLIPGTVELGSTVELKAAIKWMICKDVCVFLKDEATLSVQSGAASSEPSAEWKTLLNESGWSDLKKSP